MTKLSGKIYKSSDFAYNKCEKCFIAEYSNVPGCLRYLFENDLVIGFGIESQKTGSIRYFVLEHILHDKQRIWIFKIINPNNEEERGITVKVYDNTSR